MIKCKTLERVQKTTKKTVFMQENTKSQIQRVRKGGLFGNISVITIIITILGLINIMSIFVNADIHSIPIETDASTSTSTNTNTNTNTDINTLDMIVAPPNIEVIIDKGLTSTSTSAAQGRLVPGSLSRHIDIDNPITNSFTNLKVTISPILTNTKAGHYIEVFLPPEWDGEENREKRVKCGYNLNNGAMIDVKPLETTYLPGDGDDSAEIRVTLTENLFPETYTDTNTIINTNTNTNSNTDSKLLVLRIWCENVPTPTFPTSPTTRGAVHFSSHTFTHDYNLGNTDTNTDTNTNTNTNTETDIDTDEDSIISSISLPNSASNVFSVSETSLVEEVRLPQVYTFGEARVRGILTLSVDGTVQIDQKKVDSLVKDIIDLSEGVLDVGDLVLVKVEYHTHLSDGSVVETFPTDSNYKGVIEGVGEILVPGEITKNMIDWKNGENRENMSNSGLKANNMPWLRVIKDRKDTCEASSNTMCDSVTVSRITEGSLNPSQHQHQHQDEEEDENYDFLEDEDSHTNANINTNTVTNTNKLKIVRQTTSLMLRVPRLELEFKMRRRSLYTNTNTNTNTNTYTNANFRDIHATLLRTIQNKTSLLRLSKTLNYPLENLEKIEVFDEIYHGKVSLIEGTSSQGNVRVVMTVEEIPGSCYNYILDAGETSVDRGGPYCRAADVGKKCLIGSDCKTGRCSPDVNYFKGLTYGICASFPL